MNCAAASFSEERLRTRRVKDELRENLMARLRARRRAGISRHRRLRRHGRAADRERDSFAAQFHSAGTARTGEKPHPARADDAARSADALPCGLRSSRQSLRSDLPALPRRSCAAGRRNADRLSLARRSLRGKTGHARRDHRRPDRRHRSHQSGARRPRTVERIDGSLWPAAPRQSRHLRHQRTARPGGKNSGRTVQHHAGRRRAD